MKAEGDAFDDELFTALCSGVQAFTSIPCFLHLRRHLRLPSFPHTPAARYLLFFAAAIVYRANSLSQSGTSTSAIVQ